MPGFVDTHGRPVLSWEGDWLKGLGAECIEEEGLVG